MKSTQYQPKTGQPCHCKRGQERDNCPDCEGTGQRIDFAAIRARNPNPAPAPAASRAPLAVSCHGESTIIVNAVGQWVTGQIARGLAEDMVKAYNSHNALLAALQRLLELAEAGEGADQYGQAQARAAIAQAKGKA